MKEKFIKRRAEDWGIKIENPYKFVEHVNTYYFFLMYTFLLLFLLVAFGFVIEFGL